MGDEQQASFADGVSRLREIDSDGAFLRVAFMEKSLLAYSGDFRGSGAGKENGTQRQTHS